MIHLDTNFLIQALVVGSVSEGKLRAWITSNENVAISSIALSEFLCGPVSRDELALVEPSGAFSGYRRVESSSNI